MRVPFTAVTCAEKKSGNFKKKISADHMVLVLMLVGMSS